MTKRKPAAAGAARPTAGPIQWGIAGLSALLVLAMIAFVLHQAVTDGTGGPEIALRILRIQPSAEGFAVTFRAINGGDRTAAAVVVEGDLTREGRLLESAQVTFDYLPRHSERSGTLLFREDPRQDRLAIVAKAYREP